MQDDCFGALEGAILDAFCCSLAEVRGLGRNVCSRVMLREWEDARCHDDTDDA